MSGEAGFEPRLHGSRALSSEAVYHLALLSSCHEAEGLLENSSAFCSWVGVLVGDL